MASMEKTWKEAPRTDAAPSFRPSPLSMPAPDSQSDSTMLADMGEGAIRLFDSMVDYFSSILRLQGFRVEQEVRETLRRACYYTAAGAAAAMGLFFISVALALWLGALLESPAAGVAIVGGVYLLGATTVALMTARAARRSHEADPFVSWNLDTLKETARRHPGEGGHV